MVIMCDSREYVARPECDVICQSQLVFYDVARAACHFYRPVLAHLLGQARGCGLVARARGCAYKHAPITMDQPAFGNESHADGDDCNCRDKE